MLNTNIATNAARFPLAKALANPLAQTMAAKKNCPPNDANCKDLWISRELDGMNNIGAVGDLLTVGTDKMSEANKYFILEKYKANGLFDTQDGLTGSKATLTGAEAKDVLNNDDMFVAGDPEVGGKGNAYKSVDIKPAAGQVTTMFKDGVAGGRGITANALSEAINTKGDIAYTQYGMVVRDDAGAATKIQIAGGVPTITKPDGTKASLKPGETLTIGDSHDPVAQLRYATLPGKGEPRLVVDYFEKPTQASIDELVSKGMKPADAAALRTKTTASFGFRIPDGKGTTRSPQGLADPMLTTSNGVKTYYDVHWDEAQRTKAKVCPPPPPPVAPNEAASIWGDPHVKVADNKSANLRLVDYDIQDQGTYNILQDKGITLNATFQKQDQAHQVSVTKEAGLTLGSEKLLIKSDGNVTIDGAALTTGQSKTLKDGSVVSYVGNNLKVKTATAGEYDLNFDLKQQWGGSDYMNVDVMSRSQGVAADGVLPSGILGETFDADNIIETAAKQPIASYQRPALF
jgi:ribosome-associated protein YbcJ (S4-like RNA binding protein)